MAPEESRSSVSGQPPPSASPEVMATQPPPSMMPKREIRPGALGLLTPPQRGLALAIIQADRCGRGGDDLEDLARPNRFLHTDTTPAAQLTQRVNLLAQWPTQGAPPRPGSFRR